MKLALFVFIAPLTLHKINNIDINLRYTDNKVKTTTVR